MVQYPGRIVPRLVKVMPLPLAAPVRALRLAATPAATSGGGGWAHDVYSSDQVEFDLRAFLHQQGLSKAEVDLVVGCGKVSNIPPQAADQWAADWRSGRLLPQYRAGEARLDSSTDKRTRTCSLTYRSGLLFGTSTSTRDT